MSIEDGFKTQQLTHSVFSKLRGVQSVSLLSEATEKCLLSNQSEVVEISHDAPKSGHYQQHSFG